MFFNSHLKRSILILLAIAVLSLSYPPIQSFATDDEKELFLIAQKAFDDGFYDVATRYIQQFLEKYPQTERRTQANLLLGQCYFFKTQYLKALEIFQGLLTAKDYQDATLYWLGETYLKGSDYKQAEKQYQQVIEVYPQSSYVPQAYYSLGWAYFSEKDYAAAKKTFSGFLRQFPAHEFAEDSLFKLGECEYNNHAYENAISYFRDYVKRFPQSTRHDQAYFYIGESFFYLEKFTDAIEYHTKVTEISKDDKIVLSSKISTGWSYFKLKDFPKSQHFFDEAQQLSQEKNIPTDDIDLGRSSLFFEMGNFTKALEAYDHLIATFPDSTRLFEAHLGRANALYMLNKYPEATAEYKLIIEKFGQGANAQEILEKAYSGLGWTYLKSGNADLAITTFQEVASKSEDKNIKITALTQIGDAYQDIGQLNKALETYDKILKDFPDNPYADYVQYRQGIALLKMNSIDAATLSFQALQNNFPKSKYLNDIKYYLGLAYFKKGDWASCREQLTQFLADLPANNAFESDAQYTLGLASFNLQDYNEAMKLFQKIIKNYPEQTALVSNCEINIAKCIFNLGDPKEALKRFKIILYKYPKSEAGLETLLWLGDYYLKTSDFNNAVTYYQQLIQDFPGSDKQNIAHFGLGQAYQELGTLDKAISEYKLISDTTDRDLSAKAKLSIADIFAKDANSETAIETYRKITTVSPEYSRDAYLKIAETYRNNKDYDNAITSYEEALKADIGQSTVRNAEIEFNIADLNEILNKTQPAIDTYLKVPYLYPDDKKWVVKAYLRVARIFEKNNDWENAKMTYAKVINLGSDEAKFAQERVDWINSNAH